MTETYKMVKQVEKEQSAKVKAAGFRIEHVTEEEFEDGVGAIAGINAVKDGAWYTLREALKEIGERTDFYRMAMERNGNA